MYISGQYVLSSLYIYIMSIWGMSNYGNSANTRTFSKNLVIWETIAQQKPWNRGAEKQSHNKLKQKQTEEQFEENRGAKTQNQTKISQKKKGNKNWRARQNRVATSQFNEIEQFKLNTLTGIFINLWDISNHELNNTCIHGWSGEISYLYLQLKSSETRVSTSPRRGRTDLAVGCTLDPTSELISDVWNSVNG